MPPLRNQDTKSEVRAVVLAGAGFPPGAHYSTNKGRVPPDMIEGMYEAYRRCEQFLSTVGQPLEKAGVIKEAKIKTIKTVAENLFGVDLVEVRVARELSRKGAHQ